MNHESPLNHLKVHKEACGILSYPLKDRDEFRFENISGHPSYEDLASFRGLLSVTPSGRRPVDALSVSLHDVVPGGVAQL